MFKIFCGLICILCTADNTFGATKDRPDKIQNYKIVYFDYTEDKKFDFGKIKEPLLSEINNAIGLEVLEIEGALKDQSSYLPESIAGQKMKAILIQIDLSQNMNSPGPCEPFVDETEIKGCNYSMYIRFFADKVCISTKDEIIALANEEITDPTCSFNAPRVTLTP